MDEDDDPLLGKRLETTEQYDTHQAGAKRALQQLDAHRQQSVLASASIPGFALPDEWLLPANNSIGAALLRQMGWKDGHGIGQRVRKKKLGSATAPVAGDEDSATTQGTVGHDATDDVENEEVYVPPRNSIDVKTAFPQPKVDRYGAGFDPFVDAPEFLRYKEQQGKDRTAGSRQVVTFADAMKQTTGSNQATTAYGLSALEENDDIDVYGTTSMNEFDTEIGPRSDRKARKLLTASTGADNQQKRRQRAVCSDGRHALPGFEVASVKAKPPKAVAARLPVPPNFKPFHRFDDNEDDGANAVSALYRSHNFSTLQHGRSTPMTVKERAILLGESKAPQETASIACGSVFDLLSSSDKQKLLASASQARAGNVPSNAPASSSEVAVQNRQPLVDGASSDQLRATISASIAKRFVSSVQPSATSDDTSVDQQSLAKPSYRSQSQWIPSSLLCKRFHVKCAGQTSRSEASNSDDPRPDLFSQELVPQLVEFAAGRSSNAGARVAPRADPVPSAHALSDDKELPPLPVAARPAATLLKSIFDPSDDSASEEETDSGSEDDDSDGANDVGLTVGSGAPLAHVDEPQSDKHSAEHGRTTEAESRSSEEAHGKKSSRLTTGPSHSSELSDDHNHDSDSESNNDDKARKRKHKKRRKHDRLNDDDQHVRKRAKKDKKHKKEKKHHHSSRHSRNRDRSRSRSACRSKRKHQRR